MGKLAEAWGRVAAVWSQASASNEPRRHPSAFASKYASILGEAGPRAWVCVRLLIAVVERRRR